MSRATAVVLFATILTVSVPAETSAQLSGSHTIGGDSPDFSSFEQATAALETSGVVGAVEFLVRPGVYEQADGSERVIDIPNPISDITGRLVARLADGWHSSGEHHVRFDGRGLASGVYVYRLRAGTRSRTEKMLLLK